MSIKLTINIANLNYKILQQNAGHKTEKALHGWITQSISADAFLHLNLTERS